MRESGPASALANMEAPLDLPQAVQRGPALAPTNSATARVTASGCSNTRKCPARGRSISRDAVTVLLAERVTIAPRSRFIIKPLGHEKGRCSGAPPILERHTPAGREVGEMHRRPALDVRKY